MAQKTVTGPMGEVLGRDPVQFVLNLTRQAHDEMRALTARMANRTGTQTFTSKPINGKRFTTKMVSKKGDDVPRTALILTIWATLAPDDLIDEARRQAFKMPIGSKSADGSGVPTPFPSSFGNPEEGEPITLMAILTLAIPALVTVAIAILPALIDMIGPAAAGVFDAITGNKAKEEEAARKAREEQERAAKGKIFGIPVEFVLAAAAAGVALFIIRRKKA